MFLHALGFFCIYFSLYFESTCIQTHTKALHTCIHCHSRSKHLSTSEINQTLPTMASSSNPKKQTKRSCVKIAEPVDNNKTGYLERTKKTLRSIIMSLVERQSSVQNS